MWHAHLAREFTGGTPVPFFLQIVAKGNQIAKLNCQDAAAKVIRQALQTRMKKMCALRDRALDWNDPEGVHDMRVASRRVRSALRDFAPHLRKTKLSLSTRLLKEIADKLGVVRDCDVAIIALEKLQKKVKPEISSGLQQIIDDLKARLVPAWFQHTR